ncbi:MAG: hypothetical protein NVSMB13_09620 [Mycobacteriales bacterium]
MSGAGGTDVAGLVIAAGYLLAVPFTVFVPGFLRMWRRREPVVFVTAEIGAALIAGGFAAKHQWPAASVNAAWLVGFACLYAVEGRKRRRQAAAMRQPAGT